MTGILKDFINEPVDLEKDFSNVTAVGLGSPDIREVINSIMKLRRSRNINNDMKKDYCDCLAGCEKCKCKGEV